MALVNICAPLLAVVSLCFVPESPHWLVGQGRLEDARRALCWLRGWARPEEVAKEMALLERTLHHGSAGRHVDSLGLLSSRRGDAGWDA